MLGGYGRSYDRLGGGPVSGATKLATVSSSTHPPAPPDSRRAAPDAWTMSALLVAACAGGAMLSASPPFDGEPLAFGEQRPPVLQSEIGVSPNSTPRESTTCVSLERSSSRFSKAEAPAAPRPPGCGLQERPAAVPALDTAPCGRRPRRSDRGDGAVRPMATCLREGAPSPTPRHSYPATVRHSARAAERRSL